MKHMQTYTEISKYEQKVMLDIESLYVSQYFNISQ